MALLALGIPLGLGLFVFVYARGTSYLSDQPSACANCHIMNDQYDGWQKSSHKAVAGCNGCHTPPGTLGKYSAKALNGFLHSFAFTTGQFPDPIRIKDYNRRITEQACRHCHAGMSDSIDGTHRLKTDQKLNCTKCHAEVGHP